MNSLRRAQAAYFTAPEIQPVGPTTEQEAILEATRRLRDTAARKHVAFGKFAEALDLNRRLWIALATDVAEPSNPLPEEIKAKIFYLAEFVMQQTSRTLKGDEDVDVLVEINSLLIKPAGLGAPQP